MTKSDVLVLCRAAGEKYKLDPLLLCAIAEQESSYITDQARLEQGFYRRYTMPMKLSPSVEVLLATSFGLMQTMGESLRELGELKCEDPHDVIKTIDAYVASPEKQIDLGARWFARKLKIASGDVQKALCYWNGDMTGRYAAEVLARRDRLKTEMTK